MNVTSTIARSNEGWLVVFTFHGFGAKYDAVPKAIGPYATRELARERRDLLIDGVIAEVRKEGVHLEVIGIGPGVRVIRVLGVPS
jgi:hypothetical protein